MRQQYFFGTILSCCAAVLLSGCSSTLINERTDASGLEQPTGVPWVESRRYDVYVYAVTKNESEEPRLLHYGRYLLGDKVNGKLIDPQRPIWMTNYRSGPFSDASLVMDFHENGNLKKVELNADSKPAQAVETLTVPLNLQDQIQQKELERLQRENAIAAERAKLGES